MVQPFERIGNLLEWSATDRCLLAALVSTSDSIFSPSTIRE
jgi:hypothetical protein